MLLRLSLISALSLIQAPGSFAQLSWVSSGPGGGGALASPAMSRSGSLIVASDLGGVYRSTDGGIQWSAIGLNHGLESTHVDAVAFHPVYDGTVFLGSDNGIYKSTNCDTSPAGSCTFARTPMTGLITAIAMANSGGTESTTVYAAQLAGWCQEGFHLWRSPNTGYTWVQISPSGLPKDVNIMAIRVQPGSPNTLVAISASSRFTGCGASSGFPDIAPNRAYLSTNGGQSFSPLYIPSTVPSLLESDSTGTWAYIEDVKFDKANPNKLWATVTANPNTTSQYWSVNGELWMSSGATGVGNAFTWQSGSQTGQLWPLSTGNVRTIDLRRQHPWDTGQSGVWQWNVSSSSWSRVTTDAQFAAWQRGWTPIGYGTSLNGDLDTISVINDNVVLWADSQFAYGTVNGGVLFEEHFTAASGSPATYLSTKLDNTVPAVLKPSPTDDYLYAGYFDLGIWSATSASTASAPRWTSLNGPVTVPNSSPWNGGWDGGGGDTTGIAPDPSVAGVVWAVQSGINSGTGTYKIAKSTNHGATWTDRTYNFATLSNSEPITDLLVDAPSSTDRRLWAISNNKLFTLDDAATTWTQVSTPCDFGLMVFAKSGTHFVAGGNAGLCYSTNGGQTWARSNLNGAYWYGPGQESWWIDGYGAGVSDIAFDPANASNIWLTVIDPNWTTISGVAGLYHSTNGGATWTYVTTFAPSPYGRNFARTVAVSPNNSEIIVVGTSEAMTSGGYRLPNPGDSGTGAWVSRDGGSTWSLENAGLAWPFITKLRFTSGAAPRLWAISPGQGVVFSTVYP